MTALLGEVITTFTMVALLAVFLGFRTIRPFTPAIFPPLYAIMVWAESPISGTSTNPARSLGPSVISGQWQGWWIYWLGPLVGMLWPSSPAVSWRSASKSQSSTTSTVIGTACFAGQANKFSSDIFIS